MQINEDYYGYNNFNYNGIPVLKIADFNIKGLTDITDANIKKAIDTGKITAQELLDSSALLGEIGGGGVCEWDFYRVKDGELKHQHISHDTLPFMITAGKPTTNTEYSSQNYIYDNNDYNILSDGSYARSLGQYRAGGNNYAPEVTTSIATDVQINKLVTAPVYRIYKDGYFYSYDDERISSISYPYKIVYVTAVLGYLDFNNKLRHFYQDGVYGNQWNKPTLAINQKIEIEDVGFSSSPTQILCISPTYVSNAYTRTIYGTTYSEYAVQDYCYIYGCGIGWFTSNGGDGSGVNERAILSMGGCEIEYNSSAGRYEAVGTTISNYSDLLEFKNKIYKDLAFLGIPFIRNRHFYNSPYDVVDRTAEYYCIPEWDDGITTGNYTYGTHNLDNDAYNWESIHDNNYTIKQDEKDFGDFNSNLLNGYVTTQGCKIFAMNYAEFKEFTNFINNYSTDELQFQADFLGTNPYDYIANVLYFPTGIIEPSQSYTDVSLGHVTVKKSDDTALRCLSLSSFNDTHVSNPFNITRYFDDFRDFEPYTTIELKLPFANVLQLDCKFWYGHTLKIKTILSVANGGCKYYILRDNYIVDIIPCVIGYPLPLTALNIGTLQQNLHSLNTQLNKNTLNTITDSVNIALGFTGNPLGLLTASSGIGGLVNDVINRNQIEYNIKHQSPTVAQVSSIGDSTMQGDDIRANLVIKRAKTNAKYDENIYIQTTGHANCITGYAKNYTGFLQCANVKIKDCDLTLSEKKMIVECMNNGFIRN